MVDFEKMSAVNLLIDDIITPVFESGGTRSREDNDKYVNALEALGYIVVTGSNGDVFWIESITKD